MSSIQIIESVLFFIIQVTYSPEEMGVVIVGALEKSVKLNNRGVATNRGSW